MRFPAILSALLLFISTGYAAPKVVVSIMPAHAIVSAVMGDTGKPDLLLSGRMSEHTASFSPSQIVVLGNADVVFIMGAGLEAKLARMSGGEAVKGKMFVELSKAEGVKTLPVREGGAWEEDEHDHDHEEGHGNKFDPHTWLDPANAAAMAREVAKELSKTDPANAAAYAANAEAFVNSLDALTAEVASELAPIKDKPFIVFHDAFQYFEASFDLNAVGSIADFSAAPPSAKRLKEIRGKLKKSGAVCAFREPQFDDNFVRVVTEGTDAKTGILDAIGAELEPGPEAYSALMRNLAKSLKDCLGN